MPMIPVSGPRPQPDSWPSSPGRLTPSLDDDYTSTDDDDLDLPSFHENPLTYFLTPAPAKDDELEFNFDFDAGIEDSSNPRDIVRSISPSTLDGLKRYNPKYKASDCAVLDDDEDDNEDYIRFKPQKSLPFGFEDYFDHPKHNSPQDTLSRSTEALLSPRAFHVGSPRGRPSKRFAPPRRSFPKRPQSLSIQRRHSWREPSPDVWSIEEEPEKETMSEMGMSVGDLQDAQEDKTQPIDIPAAKPKKIVRFILPAEE
ncbi:Uu.00g091320.m01.CDS01 [Anthostomella pinea]|uniref:Uu.00g091320.m01.CDS01 n=1 Tax=Anthostomella pinea TaxID=933095 RepID=A0AAI8VP05_9PEZI|nr:Uu.00g091320.m01.CDS01 [Anthostomella pinea]